MRKCNWIWIATVLFLAGCSKPNTSSPAAQLPDGVARQAASSDRAEPVVETEPETSGGAASASEAPASRLERVIPRGTVLHVRLDETVDTRRNRAGDQFAASLSEAVMLEGRTVLPRGTRFTGHVAESKASGRLEGRAMLSITLDTFQLDGKDDPVRTGYIDRVSANHKKHNIALIGGGSGLGALIGAIAGGGKGAL
ncbi:MAG TPA: hypothetical protein VJ732_11915, partial [Bryobacteraceae bacterium]|nr:hypothetical protein [Bryobacteraceae bacterium]